MSTSRRDFLIQSACQATGGITAGVWAAACQGAAPSAPGTLQMAPFRFDVTPPLGHSLCGGWIQPATAIDDPLEAIGFVLLGAGAPLVVCAVDWTGLLNEAHSQWRTALAEAAGTTPDRVAVQCVHQHNAPFACLEAERLIQEQGDLPHIIELDFYRQCLDRGRTAVAAALLQPQPITHIGHGQAQVLQVASNRRVARHPDGRVKASRSSSCQDESLRALPEGVIDPWLKTIAFYHDDRKVVACHYYATHPMSYYGDGRVSSDFAGLARKRRQAEDTTCTHLYFTGCAGNVAAGKYNDGSHPMREVLTQRMCDALRQSEATLQRNPINQVTWKTAELLPPPHPRYSLPELEQQIRDRRRSVVDRNRPSYAWSWLRRLERRIPIVLSALSVNDVSMLHLPAECFVEYQLRAQQISPDRFIATAAYGDGGPWYIPTAEEYPHEGYEVSVAFCAPPIDPLLMAQMTNLLTPAHVAN